MIPWARATKLRFLQLANDLRDSALIGELHARLRKMANKVDDMHYKVEDIQAIGHAAPIGRSRSTGNTTQARSFLRARRFH